MRIYLRSHYGNAMKVEEKSSAVYHDTSLQVLETGISVAVLSEWDAQRWERLQKWPKTSTIGTPYPNIKVKNTLCIIITSYIACTWSNRNNIEYLVINFKAKLIRDQKLRMMILKEKAKKIFTENYCNSNIDFVCNL